MAEFRRATNQQKMVEMRRLIAQQSPQPLSQETVGGCIDFVAAYRGRCNPLPIDPVGLLLAYEAYQNKLAEEVANIDWLDTSLSNALKANLQLATDTSPGIIGCERQEAADSLQLWCRGVINRVARGVFGW
jgi:hypothetical protein